MGGTLGHLIIYNFNITKKEVLTLNTSIDCAASDPLEKALGISCPAELFNVMPKWCTNDVIVTVVSVPSVLPPVAHVLKYDNIHKIEHNDQHTVSATIMADEERFFQDPTYDQTKEPYIQAIMVDNITYNYGEFKNMVSNQIIVCTFNVDKKEVFIKKIKFENNETTSQIFETIFDFLSPNELTKVFPNWTTPDTIVVTIGVSLGSKPTGHILSHDTADKFRPNTNFSVSIKTNSDYEKVFKDDYNPSIHPYVLSFDICNTGNDNTVTHCDNGEFSLIKYEVEDKTIKETQVQSTQ